MRSRKGGFWSSLNLQKKIALVLHTSITTFLIAFMWINTNQTLVGLIVWILVTVPYFWYVLLPILRS